MDSHRSWLNDWLDFGALGSAQYGTHRDIFSAEVSFGNFLDHAYFLFFKKISILIALFLLLVTPQVERILQWNSREDNGRQGINLFSDLSEIEKFSIYGPVKR